MAPSSPVDRIDHHLTLLPPRGALGTAATLPRSLTTLVGREREIAVALTLLGRPDVRLLTLTGPGGIGKTRLAVEVARAAAADFPDGVHFVSLAAVPEADVVAATVAHAIGVPESGSVPVRDSLALALRDAGALLALDNFEHVVAAAPLLTDLLAACPRLKILVTSRALLRVTGEHALPVPPLALEAEAVRLFVERARAVNPTFDLTEETAPLATEICRRLDGLPLAIELAAARANHLPLPALREGLEQRLPLLTGGPRNAPQRLRSMHDAIAWSHELLDPGTQALFRRLAVFPGSFALDAAEFVGGGAEGRWGGELLSAPPPPSSMDSPRWSRKACCGRKRGRATLASSCWRRSGRLPGIS